MPAKKTYFNWSTGKDSALALYHVLKDKKFNVDYLLTSVNAHHDRVSMHGLRRTLLEKQIDAVGIPYGTLELPEEPSMEMYETIMRNCVEELTKKGFTDAVFGDIFLEDLRTYREKKLSVCGIQAHFPLWKRNTKDLVHEFIDLGFKAIVICTKADFLDKSFCGRELDCNFVADLPSNVDPCGENGEFHTFCYQAPFFKNPIGFEKGELVYKAYKAPQTDKEHSPEKEMGFWFCDLY
ncbi:MAG TPA: diphthine--ammonia ligase [Flavobacteriales bacterium]|nr:diphthine--ammonia ligase [Flavobacteriales bacterium]